MKPVPPAVFSDTQIECYAHAAAEVARISQICLERIAGTIDKKQAREMQETAIAEVEVVIHARGLTRDVYNKISVAARTNAALLDRINHHIDLANSRQG